MHIISIGARPRVERDCAGNGELAILGAGTVQGTRLFALEDLKRSRNNILGSCAEPRTRTGVATPHIVTPIPVTR